METKLLWITPNAEQMIVDTARVSNAANQGKDGTKLLSYLIRNRHWSPFEMASACFEINTTRDIARQILRHRSFSFQEFSQRYAEVSDVGVPIDARRQDLENRQNSIDSYSEHDKAEWGQASDDVWKFCKGMYDAAIADGMAKEVARKFLPEGLTPSKMYMSGTIRSWIHYLDVRCGNGTQKEHSDVAWSIFEELYEHIPTTMQTLMEDRK